MIPIIQFRAVSTIESITKPSPINIHPFYYVLRIEKRIRGVKSLPLASRMVKTVKNSSGSFLSSQSQKVQNKTFLGFISDLSCICPTTTVLTPLQRPRPGGRNPAPAACTEPVSYFNNSKTLISQHTFNQ